MGEWVGKHLVVHEIRERALQLQEEARGLALGEVAVEGRQVKPMLVVG